MLNLINNLLARARQESVQLSLYLLYFTLFLSSLAWFASIPFMSVYLMHRTHATPAQIGLFFSLSMLAYSLLGPFIGIILDKGYSRLLLVFFAVGIFAAFAVFFYTYTLYLFYLASLLTGVVRCGYNTFSNWYIANNVPEEKKLLAFSNSYLIFNLGAAIGPLLSSYLIENIHQSFIFTVLVYFISIGILWSISPHRRSKILIEKPLFSFSQIKNLTLWLVISALILYSVCFSQLMSTTPLSVALHIKEWNAVFAKMIAINASVVVIGMPIVRRLSETSPPRQMLLFGCGTLFIAFLIFMLAKTSFYFYVAAVFFTLAEVTIIPLSRVFIDKLAPSGQKGVFFGIYNLSFLGSFIGPVLGGAIFQYASNQWLYAFLAAISCVIFALFQVGLRRLNLTH